VDAKGYLVRICFFADADFLTTFGIPTALSAYGSTEAGGVTDLKVCRRGDRVVHPERMSKLAGTARSEIECRVVEGGQLEVRSMRQPVLFEGRATPDGVRAPFDADGWFTTGDRMRIDEDGDLVFVERLSDSIRLGGE
jgi:long-subunit acyl-CoA synthetase (AMP-forming)